MTRHARSLVSAALLDDLLNDSGDASVAVETGGEDTFAFARFPSLHDRLEASRFVPGPAPYGLWSDDPWGGDAA